MSVTLASIPAIFLLKIDGTRASRCQLSPVAESIDSMPLVPRTCLKILNTTFKVSLSFDTESFLVNKLQILNTSMTTPLIYCSCEVQAPQHQKIYGALPIFSNLLSVDRAGELDEWAKVRRSAELIFRTTPLGREL